MRMEVKAEGTAGRGTGEDDTHTHSCGVRDMGWRSWVLHDGYNLDQCGRIVREGQVQTHSIAEQRESAEFIQ